MKIFKHLLVFVLLSLLVACNSVSGPVHFYPGQPRPATETAQVKIPAAITVVKIDGEKVNVPSKEEGYYYLYLLPGLHRIEFKYELTWGNDGGMLLRSNVTGIETRLYAGMHYELTYPVPEGEREAYFLASEFKANLVEVKTGRQVKSRSIAELGEFRTNVVNQPTSAVVGIPDRSEVVTRPEDTVTPATIDADTATREDAVKRLKFWWLMANEVERERFRRWMKQVDSAEKQGVE